MNILFSQDTDQYIKINCSYILIANNWKERLKNCTIYNSIKKILRNKCNEWHLTFFYYTKNIKYYKEKLNRINIHEELCDVNILENSAIFCF